MVRNNNQLPNNLPQLQNCIKRDSESYKDEFLQQQRHFSAMMDVLKMDPGRPDKTFEEIVMFMAQVSHCYPDHLKDLGTDLINILRTHGQQLHPDVRKATVKSLVLMRNKGLLSISHLLTLFFQLLRCQDKGLRSFLRTHIITDIKNSNKKHKNHKENSALQTFLFTMLKDNNPIASKVSLDIMIELYRKQVWKDQKTVNGIATCLFSKNVKMMVAALTFFLGKDDQEEDDHRDSDDTDVEEATDPKKKLLANKFNRKSKKRQKAVDRDAKKEKKKTKSRDKRRFFDTESLHFLYDPSDLAEKLLHLLNTTNERFEVKLQLMNLISRLCGVHQLFLFNFYPLLQRYLTPHQKEVTRILTFTAQAVHALLPPDTVHSIIRTIADSFISERNSSECITVGLNSVREICSRCPLAMDKDMLQDLTMYQKFRDKNVTMSARSLVHLYRLINPDLLMKKDRGKPTESSIELKVKEYGESDNKSYIPGAEVLAQKEETEEAEGGAEENDDWETDEEDDGDEGDNNDGWESDSEVEDGDDEGWTNVNESSEEEGDDREDGGDSNGEEGEPVEPKGPESKRDKRKRRRETKRLNSKKSRKEINVERLTEMKETAEEITSSRFLTDDEFKQIRKNQIKKHIEALHPRRKRGEEEMEMADSSDDEQIDDLTGNREIVPLKRIERLYKKSRASKEARLESIMEGREGRDKFSKKRDKMNPHASSNDKEKKRNKAFPMIKYKMKGKAKKSFREKQQSLKKALVKQAKQN